MDSCRRLLQSDMLFPQMDVEQMQRQCCQELQEVKQECMCEAVRQMAQISQGSHGGQQQQMKEVLRKAQQLPMMCGRQSQPCEIYETNTRQMVSRCRRHLRGVKLDNCKRFLQPHILLLLTMDPEQYEVQAQCCAELWVVHPQCMCEAMRLTVQSLTGSQRGPQQQQMQEMMRKAREQPRVCQLRSQDCDFR